MEGQTYSIIRVHRDRVGEWEKIVPCPDARFTPGHPGPRPQVSSK